MKINFVFNYQLVFKFKDERIIFAGSTTLSLPELLEEKKEFYTSDYVLESVMYQPNNYNDEQKKKTE